MYVDWLLQHGWEALAVVLGLAYLLLAMRESLWCWHAAFLSTAIYLFLFWQTGLYMESSLQIYYLIMAVYGWWYWRSGNSDATAAPIVVWPARKHVLAIAAVIVASFVSGFLLSKVSSARMPYLDSFTTWGALLTTWMVARKLLENWIYWIVIDSISLFIYWNRGLYLTALLFAAYLVIVIFGFLQWRRLFDEQHPEPAAQGAL